MRATRKICHPTRAQMLEASRDLPEKRLVRREFPMSAAATDEGKRRPLVVPLASPSNMARSSSRKRTVSNRATVEPG